MTSVGVTKPSGNGGRRLPLGPDTATLELQRMRALNRQLRAELEVSMNELRDSHARLMSAAVQERRRIERDLHDGAQQRLVAAQVRAGLAHEILAQHPERARQLLETICVDLEGAVEELRSLAHGLYPSVLSDRGIAAALREATRHTPLAVTIEPDGAGRYSPEIESAVYFCCLESLQNAVKHARGASRVSVTLAAGDELSFTVTDDGSGVAVAAMPEAGAGLTNMRDRLATVHGHLEVRSAPGAGTRVTGTIPLAYKA